MAAVILMECEPSDFKNFDTKPLLFDTWKEPIKSENNKFNLFKQRRINRARMPFYNYYRYRQAEHWEKRDFHRQQDNIFDNTAEHGSK